MTFIIEIVPNHITQNRNLRQTVAGNVFFVMGDIIAKRKENIVSTAPTYSFCENVRK